MKKKKNLNRNFAEVPIPAPYDTPVTINMTVVP